MRKLMESDIARIVKKVILEMQVSQDVWKTLNWASYSDKASYLEKHGFAVYDDESESDLDNAIVGMVEDGDVTDDNVIMHFE